MAITQTNDVADHRHDSCGARVGLYHLPPLAGTSTGTPQFPELVLNRKLAVAFGITQKIRNDTSQFHDLVLHRKWQSTVP